MYVPHSDVDLKKIFKELSIKSLDELFSHIPKELILNDGLNQYIYLLHLTKTNPQT